MRKVLIYVEGQTEERFVKDILRGHLEARGICAVPVVARTKIVKSGGHFKGGVPPFGRVRRELLRLLGDSSAVAVTTLLDYYGLPDDFPGCRNPDGRDCHERVRFVEAQIGDAIGDPKFIPHLTLHEYEGLLFSAPAEIARTLLGSNAMEIKLSRIRQAFSTPEEINDDPNTAPHSRIENLYPRYNKPLHGALISARIGLDAIRRECPHFNQWLTRLEGV